MGWRPPWWAALLLLLLTGPEASSQQGEDEAVPLEEENTTPAHDYPTEEDGGFEFYDDVYYDSIFVGNTTLHKCRCRGTQAWDGDQCQDAVTTVAVIDHWTEHRMHVNTSEFSVVEVAEVVCPEGHSKVVLHHNKEMSHDFSVMDYGALYWRGTYFGHFCIDHILVADGEASAMEAHLCLPAPPVSVCCPPGHAILPNGTCYPYDGALNVPLSMEVEGQPVSWQIDGMAEITNFTCGPDDTHYRRLAEANVSLVYDPHGLELQWLAPTITNKPINRQEYCVGVEVGGPGHAPQYSTLFCYKDRSIAHREACHNATCVRKCCPDHSVMLGVECVFAQNPNMEWTPKFHHSGSLVPDAPPPEDLAIVHGYPICSDIFQLQPHESEEDRYYLLQDGTLHVPAFPDPFPATMYCLDSFITHHHHVQEHPLVCFDDKAVLCNNVRSTAYPALQAVSCVFLAVTLLVYVSVPELHAKVHGKCLVSHVTALLLAYLCLIIVQLTSGNLPDIACKIMASLTHISFLAAFFWLNVMCFDIWWTLKSMRPVAETGELSRLRFKMYSFYSWGCPALISVAAVIVDSLPEDFDVLRPGFGTMKCWFADNHPLWAYFYGFVLALVLANIILFCQVAYILIMAQNDPILQRTRQQNRERMWLYIKLFVVMGLTWITEVISWQEGSCEAWIIPDVINALQGFSIFLIFICKRNMLKRIRTNWEPYLRRMKVFVGSSRQPDSAKGKGVQDTSSFTSSVNRPISQSNASQRTVQSQISLDTISSVRKLSTSSLVSTTGVQIHNANSLCMDTIAEAAASEAEEMSQEDNSQVPADTPAAPPAPDVPTASQSDAKEDTQEKNSEKTEEQLPAETEAEAPEEDQEGDLGTAPHTGSEDVAPSVTQTPHQTEVEGAPVHGDVEGVTLQQHYNQAYIADELEEQPIQV